MLLLAQCPNLEDLRVTDIYFYDEEDSRSCDNWKNFTLSNLTKADADSSYFDFPMKALHNVQFLSMCISTAQV
jgi:hypothetical protein